MRAIATIGTGPMAPVLEVALRTIRPYAARHGYELVIGDGDAKGRPASWAKVPLLRGLLKTHSEVLWLDADVVVLNGDRDLAADVPPEAWQALVGVRDNLLDDPVPNCGVWFLRAGETAEAFLDAVWDRESYVRARGLPGWENAAVIDLLGYEGWPEAPRIRESPWLDGTVLLPQEWNMEFWFHGLSKARIRHYCVVPNRERERWMAVDAAWVDAQRLGWTPGRAVAYAFLATRRWVDRHVARDPRSLPARLIRLTKRDERRAALAR